MGAVRQQFESTLRSLGVAPMATTLATLQPLHEGVTTAQALRLVQAILKAAPAEARLCWIHTRGAQASLEIYPPALEQQGVPVQRLVFLEVSPAALGTALQSTLRSQIFCGVLVEGHPSLKDAERQRYRMLAKRSNCPVVVLAPS